MVPDVLRTHLESGHPTDSGPRFHNAKDSDSSSRRNLSLNRSEGFDGFDGGNGRGDEFYGYTRLRQPNHTLTGHLDRTRSGRVRGAVWQEFGSTLCEHPRRASGQHPRRSSDQHPRMSSCQHQYLFEEIS
jgi:hypothetical protein